MKIGIIISTNEAETCWNAFRYANFCLGQKDEVKVFLISKGVEYETTGTAPFDARSEAQKCLDSGGRIYACGTCLKSRQQKGSDICPLSTMKDMYDIVRESDRIVTF